MGLTLEQSYQVERGAIQLIVQYCHDRVDTESILKVVVGGVRTRAQSSEQHKYLLSQVWLSNSANVLAPRFWVSYGVTI